MRKRPADKQHTITNYTTSTMTASTGTVAISDAWGNLELHYGTPTTPGFSFSRTINIPSGFSGNTEYRQVINENRRRQKNDDSWQRYSGNNLLDNYLPYDDTSATDDSPGTPLSDDLKVKTVSDTFTMWLMFKPSNTDSIWVPLRSINWSWSGTATRSGTTWTLTSPGDTPNPSSSTTTTFPTWVGNCKDLTWVNE